MYPYRKSQSASAELARHMVTSVHPKAEEESLHEIISGFYTSNDFS